MDEQSEPDDELWDAAEAGALKRVRALVEEGANVNGRSQYGTPPLAFGCIY